MAWVTVLASDDIGPGQVRAVEADGRSLVLWCTAGGQAVVMDGRCPHTWSPLAFEGVVEGDELVCTAHCWRFAPDGTGTKVNVLGRRDRKGDIETMACRRRGGRLEVDVPGAAPGA